VPGSTQGYKALKKIPLQSEGSIVVHQHTYIYSQFINIVNDLSFPSPTVSYSLVLYTKIIRNSGQELFLQR